MKAFSVFDSKVEVFDKPFFMRTTAEAIRGWGQVCNDPKTAMGSFPGDFSLFEIGSFDPDTGTLVPLKAPHRVASGIEVVRKDSPVRMTEVPAGALS